MKQTKTVTWRIEYWVLQLRAWKATVSGAKSKTEALEQFDAMLERVAYGFEGRRYNVVTQTDFSLNYGRGRRELHRFYTPVMTFRVEGGKRVKAEHET